MPARIRRHGASLGLTALLVTVLALAFAAPVRAQVVTDPRIAEFDPSPDHWAVLDNGQAAVARYELAMYSVGAATPFATVDMGKPNPEADGKIRYDFSAAATNWPLPGGNYEARVNAVGPEGAALSEPSNPFTFTTPGGCTVTLSNTTVQAPAAGGSYSITVSTDTTCGWTATTALPWVSLWVSSGAGNGTVPFQVQANTSTSSRSGTITIFNQAVTVSQAGATQPPAAFGKASPANGATGLGSALTLSWGAASGATSYQVCVDTTNDGACGATWQSAGTATTLARSGLAAGTYYWQVRAQNAGGTTDANGGAWWSFAVAGATQPPAAFAKASPANGATGLGSALTLSWGTATGATGYQVCVDTTNDGACGTAWQSAGTATSLAQSGLAAGTYYWQVRAQNAGGTTDANGGAWWSFAVAGAAQPPAAFAKASPANGATGQGSTLTLTWSAVADAGYWVCWDTTNNNTCDGAWWPNGGGAGRILTGLAAGTYYWQVRAQTASGTVDANSGTWWSFAVSGTAQPQPPAAFGKASPANGATGLGSALTLSWAAATGATGYQMCVDTTNDGACGTAWQSAGAATSLVQSGLAAGTYYWQVRAQNAAGTTDANGGAWWSFAVAGATQPPAAFGKSAPVNGATGQGSTVTVTWTALPDSGYWVCWDTTNNNTCDGAWWPNGGGAGRILTGLPAGTYYWHVRAQTPGGLVDADNATWWSFTVGGATLPQPPTAFGKVSPASGTAGLGNGVTLSWGAAAGATSYEVCVDTTNDNACSTTWRAAYTSTAAGLSGLAAGTYYWQVRALNPSGTTYADADRWWIFSVSGGSQPAATFGKLSPASGTTGLTSTVTLTWSAVADAGYWVCWDTTNNNACDGAWWPNGGGAGRVLTGLPPGTYYWTVRAQTSSGIADADSGTWWSFTVR
jgi:hypothetical protein